jgi:hypothetical protein
MIRCLPSVICCVLGYASHLPVVFAGTHPTLPQDLSVAREATYPSQLAQESMDKTPTQQSTPTSDILVDTSA